MPTALLVFVVVSLKGVLLSVAYRKGWIRSPEKVRADHAEKKAVLRAYKQWRERAGPEASAHLRAKLLARSSGSRPLD